ncbi:MAG: PadR family transcriptional regulator [Acholeplasmatales bacterium]|nr:MAG: PadR family transcriptional regulator [Acholeplasmatales bacterium]
MNAQFKKGVLDLVLLHIVHTGPVSAYDILVKTSSGLQVNENTIYPLLRRLERDGYLKHEKQQGEMGAPKKVFLLTDVGRSHYLERLEAWRTFQKEVSHVLGGADDA